MDDGAFRCINARASREPGIGVVTIVRRTLFEGDTFQIGRSRRARGPMRAAMSNRKPPTLSCCPLVACSPSTMRLAVPWSGRRAMPSCLPRACRIELAFPAPSGIVRSRARTSHDAHLCLWRQTLGQCTWALRMHGFQDQQSTELPGWDGSHAAEPRHRQTQATNHRPGRRRETPSLAERAYAQAPYGRFLAKEIDNHVGDRSVPICTKTDCVRNCPMVELTL